MSISQSVYTPTAPVMGKRNRADAIYIPLVSHVSRSYETMSPTVFELQLDTVFFMCYTILEASWPRFLIPLFLSFGFRQLTISACCLVEAIHMIKNSTGQAHGSLMGLFLARDDALMYCFPYLM